MNSSKNNLKVSTLIKNSCCGSLLDVPKSELVKMAEDMEAMNERLIAELDEITKAQKNRFVLFAFLWLASCLWVLS